MVIGYGNQGDVRVFRQKSAQVMRVNSAMQGRHARTAHASDERKMYVVAVKVQDVEVCGFPEDDLQHPNVMRQSLATFRISPECLFAYGN